MEFTASFAPSWGRHKQEASAKTVASSKPYPELKLEYACVYGISSQVADLEPGVWSNVLDKQLTIHFIAVKGGGYFGFSLSRRNSTSRPITGGVSPQSRLDRYVIVWGPKDLVRL